MPNFVLSLYRKKPPSPTLRVGLGKLEFEASDRLAAIEHVQREYVERLEECDYAVLLTAEGEHVWEKGSVRA